MIDVQIENYLQFYTYNNIDYQNIEIEISCQLKTTIRLLLRLLQKLSAKTLCWFLQTLLACLQFPCWSCPSDQVPVG